MDGFEDKKKAKLDKNGKKRFGMDTKKALTQN